MVLGTSKVRQDDKFGPLPLEGHKDESNPQVSEGQRQNGSRRTKALNDINYMLFVLHILSNLVTMPHLMGLESPFKVECWIKKGHVVKTVNLFRNLLMSRSDEVPMYRMCSLSFLRIKLYSTLNNARLGISIVSTIILFVTKIGESFHASLIIDKGTQARVNKVEKSSIPH